MTATHYSHMEINIAYLSYLLNLTFETRSSSYDSRGGYIIRKK